MRISAASAMRTTVELPDLNMWLVQLVSFDRDFERFKGLNWLQIS